MTETLPSRRYRTTRIGAAATIALFLIGGAALIAVRSGQRAASPSPSSEKQAAFDLVTGDWGWRRVGEPAPGHVAQVAGGYLGECVSGGVPAACTSIDALAWTLPADPALISPDAGTSAGDWSVAHEASVWVAVGTVRPGVWRSVDGKNWLPVATDLPGLQSALVETFAGGFAIEAKVADHPNQQPTRKVLTSSDGTTWLPLDLPAGVASPQLAGAIGLIATRAGDAGGSESGGFVSSSDGVTWQPTILPSNVYGLVDAVRLQNGHYVGMGSAARPGGGGAVITSSDGRTWTAPAGLGFGFGSMAVVGPRVLAIAGIPNSSLTALWQSTDGTGWQRMAVLDGTDFAGMQLVSLGDRLVGLAASSRLTWVGQFSPGASSRPSPSAPVTPPAVASPSLASPQALVVGGWRWHRLESKPQGVVRVPKGYLGRCGNSMCTSADGWTWHTPPDPAIFSADATAVFTPIEIAHQAGAGYAILAAEGLWYSADGISWNASTTPSEPHGFMGLVASAAGYALIGQPNDTADPDPRIYVSSDGAAWRQDGHLTYGTFIGIYDTAPDTAGGLLANMPKNNNKYLYSADGRTWTTATMPAGVMVQDQPRRLADGSMVLFSSADAQLLRSADGRAWSRAAKVFDAGSMAIAGRRIIVAGSSGGFGGGGVVESRDGGRTVHKLMDGSGHVEQFGDLVLLATDGGGMFVGAPLSESEAPSTTPTAPRLPASSPAPTPSPRTTPANGISRDEALRIAIAAVEPPAAQVASASLNADAGPPYGRWVWHVSFLQSYEGPLAAQGTFVDIDFFTGAVIGSGQWIS
jgi:hypothetical protein